jgi:hypothetical protein
MRKKMAISMAVVVLLLIGIMATSVLASTTALATDAGLATNTAVSNQLRANTVSANAFSVAAGDFAVKPVSPVPEVVDDEEPEVGSGNQVEDLVYDDLESMDVDELKKTVLETYEETDALIITRVRFLLYTHDGEHVMWGYVGNGYFVGQDNHGKNCWGIYGKNVFAGFYDGEFFWGKYRCGNWKAIGLFGENYSFGKYILFPTTSVRP